MSSPYLFHLKSDWPDMTGVPDLAVIKGRHPHEDAALQRHVVLAAGIELARHFERPVPAGPARRAADVGAVAGELAGENHARQHGALRDQPVELRSGGNRFGFGDEPARALALAEVWVERNDPERRRGRREGLWQRTGGHQR